jgi:hypothetical protein
LPRSSSAVRQRRGDGAKKFPRADLVAAFLTGVDMVNKNGSTAR